MKTSSHYSRWLEYFETRQGRELSLPHQAPIRAGRGRAALAASLARFELGESGDGERLRRLATATGDASYARAIELFVAEEGQHAVWLRMLRERFGGERLESHWSDGAFVLLRHLGGLRLELCVLLAAEVIALTYYRVLPLAHPDPVLRAVCERIVSDERGHVAFHRAALSREFGFLPPAARAVAILGWRIFVAVTAAVVAWDHRRALELAGTTRGEFTHDIRARAARLARVFRAGGLEARPEPPLPV